MIIFCLLVPRMKISLSFMNGALYLRLKSWMCTCECMCVCYWKLAHACRPACVTVLWDILGQGLSSDPFLFSLSLIPFALNTWIPSFHKHAFLCFLYSFPPTLFPLASWPNLLTGEHIAISTENYTPLGLLLPSRVDTPSVEVPVHHEGCLSKCGHVWHIERPPT